MQLKDGKAGSTSKGFITVRLSTHEPTQAGEIVRSNAREDIKRGGISNSAAAAGFGVVQVMDATLGAVSEPGGLDMALGSVVSKLDIFVKIIDKTSQVSVRKPYVWNVPDRVTSGSPVCQFCLAGDFFTVQGTIVRSLPDTLLIN